MLLPRRVFGVLVVLGAVALLAVASVACESSVKKSVEKARGHAESLAKALALDVEEVRKGLPEGTQHLEKLYRAEAPPDTDLPAVRIGLARARDKVQDLRTAKSTFFALVSAEGVVVRNDQEQDAMVGKDVFGPFAALRKAVTEGKYMEARGTMAEASGLDGRSDAQWVAAAPVKIDGAVKGLYVTGWSWSSYAYRLENALRTEARPPADDPVAKAPLTYALVLVDGEVYGAPATPDVSLTAVKNLAPLTKVDASGTASMEIEITGRAFGLAVKSVPEAGEGVGVGVLRSET